MTMAFCAAGSCLMTQPRLVCYSLVVGSCASSCSCEMQNDSCSLCISRVDAAALVHPPVECNRCVSVVSQPAVGFLPVLIIYKWGAPSRAHARSARIF